MQGPLREVTSLLQHLQLWDPSQASPPVSLHQSNSPPPTSRGPQPHLCLGPPALLCLAPPHPLAFLLQSLSHRTTCRPLCPQPLPPGRKPSFVFRRAQLLGWIALQGLGESNLTPARRLERAWRAGQWARLVLAGHYASPLPSENLRLASRYYPVLGGGGAQPCLYTSFRACQAVLGPISGSSAVFHGFPSELEAKVYVDAAGFAWPLGGQ